MMAPPHAEPAVAKEAEPAGPDPGSFDTLHREVKGALAGVQHVVEACSGA